MENTPWSGCALICVVFYGLVAILFSVSMTAEDDDEDGERKCENVVCEM